MSTGRGIETIEPRLVVPVAGYRVSPNSDLLSKNKGHSPYFVFRDDTYRHGCHGCHGQPRQPRQPRTATDSHGQPRTATDSHRQPRTAVVCGWFQLYRTPCRSVSELGRRPLFIRSFSFQKEKLRKFCDSPRENPTLKDTRGTRKPPAAPRAPVAARASDRALVGVESIRCRHVAQQLARSEGERRLRPRRTSPLSRHAAFTFVA